MREMHIMGYWKAAEKAEGKNGSPELEDKGKGHEGR
jgi:hypothetical protein